MPHLLFQIITHFLFIITLPYYHSTYTYQCINYIFLFFFTLNTQEIKIEEKKDEDVNREAVAVRMQLKHRTKIVNILSDTLTKLNDVYSVAKKFDRYKKQQQQKTLCTLKTKTNF